MKKIIKLAAAVSVVLCGACTDMFHTVQGYLDEGEYLYASKIDSLKALSGDERALITGLLMYGYDTKKCVIRWQPGDGEVVIPIERQEPVEKFEYSITGLTDGYYTFEVTTFDDENTPSLVQTLDVRVYGDVYRSTLRARSVDKAEQDDENVVVSLTGVLQDSYKSVIVYRDKAGVEQRRDIAVTDMSVTLEDWESEGAYVIEPYYRPNETAVDLFMVKSEIFYFPKYERIAMVPKEGFVPVVLDNDLALTAWGGNLAHAFNGVINDNDFAHSWGGWENGPAWFTFDMGKSAVLQAFRLNGNTADSRAFSNGYMKQWEVWGRNDAPSQDGSWEGWTKLMDCQSVKPSGLPVGQLSEEDRTRVAEGETFLFPKGVPEVRYIRFKVNDVWNTAEGRFLTFTELTFWEYLPQE